MGAVNLVAQVPPTPESIVARVRDELARGCREVSLPPPGELDRPATAAVRLFWDSQDGVFVSVPALRQARDVRGVVRLDPGSVVAGGPAPFPVEAVVRDQDELVPDERDVLTLSDDGPA